MERTHKDSHEISKPIVSTRKKRLDRETKKPKTLEITKAGSRYLKLVKQKKICEKVIFCFVFSLNYLSRWMFWNCSSFSLCRNQKLINFLFTINNMLLHYNALFNDSLKFILTWNYVVFYVSVPVVILHGLFEVYD